MKIAAFRDRFVALTEMCISWCGNLNAVDPLRCDLKNLLKMLHVYHLGTSNVIRERSGRAR